MSNPYFEIGEEVILVSVMHPRLNGDHVVEWVCPAGEVTNPFKENSIITGDSIGYKLVGIQPSDEGSKTSIFAQSALRKKHKPSDESFSELMHNYKTETVQ